MHSPTNHNYIRHNLSHLTASTPFRHQPASYTGAEMSSKRRRAASRANGKKSHGPVTPEGKARSAANSTTTRHGLASPDRATHAVCLRNENPAEFNLLHQSLIIEHAPVTTTEHLTVHEMTVCRWRVQRAWAMQDALVDNQMDHMVNQLAETYEATDEPTRAALAFRKLAEDSPSISVLLRYEARLTRQFDRCLIRLAALRAWREKHGMQAEPNPTNEHPHDHQLPASGPILPPQPAPVPDRQPGVAPAHTPPQMGAVRPSGPQHDSEMLPGLPPVLPRAA